MAMEVIRQWDGSNWIALVNHGYEADSVPAYNAVEEPRFGDLRSFREFAEPQARQDQRRDEFDAIHASLLADVRQQEDYLYGQVSAIAAYSEGAEHALDTVRLRLGEQQHAAEKLAEVERYLDELMDPSTVEFESSDVRRVVRVVAGKLRSIITGEAEVDPDAPTDRTKALIEQLQRQVFRQ